MPEPLSAADARRLALRAQGLLGAPDRRGGVHALLRRLGAVQLDTIAVLARSHELVPYARLGPIGRDAVERAYWTGRPSAFEYWSHAACVLPLEHWPLYAFRRRWFRARGQRWHRVDDATCRAVLERLRAEGPLTTKELGGGRRGGPWWDWSDVKVAVEWLLDTGDAVCVERRGFQRVYDLPERVLSARAAGSGPRRRRLPARSRGGGRAGARRGHARRPRRPAPPPWRAGRGGGRRHRPRRGRGRGLARPRLGRARGARGPRGAGRHRTTLLSPFDSLVWDRRRTERLFGFAHRLEAYVPAAKRVHGYFAMPLLAGGRLVGRVDPGREGRTLVAKQLTVDVRSAPAMAAALREAATWVGCDAVALGRVEPAAAAPALAHELG